MLSLHKCDDNSGYLVWVLTGIASEKSENLVSTVARRAVINYDVGF